MATFGFKHGNGKMEISYSRDGGSASVGAFITGAADETTAQAVADANVPATFLGMFLQDYSISERGGGLWDVTINYSPVDRSEPAVSFETSGGTQTITQALATIGTYTNDDPVIDFKGAIRPSDQSVEGCEITVPVFNFTETHYFPVSSPPSQATIFGVTGKVNSDAFRGFAIGEVLFLGASGSQQGDEDWQVDYSFAASPNVTGLSIGGITGITKRGWDYLWVYYANVQDDTGKVVRRVPRQVNVEQVYQYTPFSGLGI